MARPKKTGLDYFPHDVHLSSDNKFQCVEALHGLTGYAVCVKLFEIAYQDSSGCVSIPDDEALIILANRFRLSPEVTMKIIQTAIKYNLFDRAAWDAEKKLTSNGIQRRLAEVDAMRGRCRKKPDQQNQLPASLAGVIPVDNPEETGESKGKESKGKESKEEDLSVAVPAPAQQLTIVPPLPAKTPKPAPAPKPQRHRRGPEGSQWFLCTDEQYAAKVKERGQAWVEFWILRFCTWAGGENPAASTKIKDHFLEVEGWELREEQAGRTWYEPAGCYLNGDQYREAERKANASDQGLKGLVKEKGK